MATTDQASSAASDRPAGPGSPGNRPSRPDVDPAVSPAPAAFRQQLIGHIPRLRRYARTLVFDFHRADDLVQTTLERALTHWHQFDQRRDMAVWLLSIAHNAHMRPAATRPPARGLRPQHLQRPAGPRAAVMPVPTWACAWTWWRPWRGCRPEQRESLLLVCVEQLSYAEVAEVMQRAAWAP